MSEVAQYAVRDGIAVITLNNPPVNGLGNALRAAIMEHLKKAEADPAVKAVVIIGSAKFFSGGADIREFGGTRLQARPARRQRLPGRDAEAAGRRDRRLRPRRRPRARARLPLPRRRCPSRRSACRR